MSRPRQAHRWPASVTIPMVWATYVLALVLTLPFTPLGVLWMLGPLLVTGWYARNWIIPAVVGLGHGAALAAVTVWLGVFPLAPGDPGLALAAGLLVLLSWFTAIAGRTVRLVNVVREQDRILAEARDEIETNAASVEALWDATAVALITLDSQARVISWNPGAEQVFGRSAASMQGRPLAELSAAGDPDDCMGPIQYALEMQRRTPPFEGRLRDGRGQTLDVEVRARPVTHPGGDPGLILAVIDRTREHVMEDILEEQAERQDRLVQNLEEVLYSVEVPSRQTVMLTKTVESLTGHGIAEFGDFASFLALAHPDDAKAVRDRWEHARSGEKSTLRWRVNTGRGHVWVEDRIVPVRNDEGRVIRLDGIVRRIFREIELERQAQRMTRWLDALEPLAGTGAWSLDLRSGDWTWSAGMARMLGSKEADYHHWARCVMAKDRPILEAMVDDPESFAGPQRLHLRTDAGPVPYVVEAWLQRGNDGEPIHLYGVLRQELELAGTDPRTALPSAVPATKLGARPIMRRGRLPRAVVAQAWPDEASEDVDIEEIQAAPTSMEADDPGSDETGLEDEIEEDILSAAMVTDVEMEAIGEDEAMGTDRDEDIDAYTDEVGQEQWDDGSDDELAVPDEATLADPLDAPLTAFDDPMSGDVVEEASAEDEPLPVTGPAHAGPAPRARASAQMSPGVHAVQDEERPDAIDEVTWDDDVGWVPKKRPTSLVPQAGVDAAEALAAKQWSDKDRPKAKGPWSID